MRFDTTEPIGRILHLQRLSTEDGPGLRTTVFFKGCPLNCAWCHNPESISPYFQVQWLEHRCIGCNTCLSVCPNGGLSRTPAGLHIDRELCTGCGECAAACPANALERLGDPVEVGTLVSELLKDRAFFNSSNGGVTLSGGEPTMQPNFAAFLLAELRAAGVQTALDTCGLCNRVTLQHLLPLLDLILYDLKILDPVQHLHHTGQDNAVILGNLSWLGETLRKSPGPRLWVRTPLIPGATDQPENIAGIGRFLAEHLGGEVERWELCAFNNLCRDKYTRLGLKWDYASAPLMSRAQLDGLESQARKSGLPPERVAVTGAARLETTPL